MPQKQPISIMPSSPMFTTPLRSEIMPPSAANSSGVAKRSIAAISADQVKTDSSVAADEFADAAAPRDREQGDDDRPASELALAAGDRPRPGARRRARRARSTAPAANLDRRDRDHPGDRGEDDARDADLLRRHGARAASTAIAPTLTTAPPWARAGLLGRPASERHAAICRQPFSSRSVITSVETSSTMSPSIMNVRYCDQRRIDAQVDVAIRGAGQERAEQQRRGDRADRGVAAEQRHRDPEEADLRGLDVVARTG